MFTYFYVMNDYGFKLGTVLMLSMANGYVPDENDIYNPDLPNFGNSNYGKADLWRPIAWGL